MHLFSFLKETAKGRRSHPRQEAGLELPKTLEIPQVLESANVERYVSSFGHLAKSPASVKSFFLSSAKWKRSPPLSL